VRPTARAFAATGRRGTTIRLRYRVFDNRGFTRELVTVYRGKTQRVRRIATRYAATGARGKVYFVRWKAPRRVGARSWRFCVQAFDRAGNKSRASCAGIKLRR
jgi:hypothetical protein